MAVREIRRLTSAGGDQHRLRGPHLRRLWGGLAVYIGALVHCPRISEALFLGAGAHRAGGGHIGQSNSCALVSLRFRRGIRLTADCAYIRPTNVFMQRLLRRRRIALKIASIHLVRLDCGMSCWMHG